MQIKHPRRTAVAAAVVAGVALGVTASVPAIADDKHGTLVKLDPPPVCLDNGPITYTPAPGAKQITVPKCPPVDHKTPACTNLPGGTDGKVYDMETGREIPHCPQPTQTKPAGAAKQGKPNWRERARLADQAFAARKDFGATAAKSVKAAETAANPDRQRNATPAGSSFADQQRAKDAAFACAHGKPQFC